MLYRFTLLKHSQQYTALPLKLVIYNFLIRRFVMKLLLYVQRDMCASFHENQ